MRLASEESHRRLVAHDHAILATVHTRRGVDAVPVCFAVDAGHVVVPIDQVKPKATPALQRKANLDADPRATLLAEAWDPDDWSKLWWVRAELRRVAGDEARRAHLEALLRDKYVQYADLPFSDVIVFEIIGISGRAAAEV